MQSRRAWYVILKDLLVKSFNKGLRSIIEIVEVHNKDSSWFLIELFET